MEGPGGGGPRSRNLSGDFDAAGMSHLSHFMKVEREAQKGEITVRVPSDRASRSDLWTPMPAVFPFVTWGHSLFDLHKGSGP